MAPVRKLIRTGLVRKNVGKIRKPKVKVRKGARVRKKGALAKDSKSIIFHS